MIRPFYYFLVSVPVFFSSSAFAFLTVTNNKISHHDSTTAGSSGTTTSALFAQQLTRRDVALTVPAALSSLLFVTSPANAAMGDTPDQPIVVLGAGGKCGKLCVDLLTSQSKYCRAVTRSGRGKDFPYCTNVAGDVTDYASLVKVLENASGVIFAASASGKSKGGTPLDVDYKGAYYTAQACLECRVPKLALISAGTVSRPDSLGFKATNFAVKFVYGDRIMDAKMAGETAVRDLCRENGGLAYTIIRPGGLSDGPAVGAPRLHLSQGDVYSSEISRADVAAITVAALLKGAATDYTTLEINNLQGVYKCQGDLDDLPSALVHAGANSYNELLDGLLSDSDLLKQYGSIVNSEFRGDGMPLPQDLV